MHHSESSFWDKTKEKTQKKQNNEVPQNALFSCSLTCLQKTLCKKNKKEKSHFFFWDNNLMVSDRLILSQKKKRCEITLSSRPKSSFELKIRGLAETILLKLLFWAQKSFLLWEAKSFCQFFVFETILICQMSFDYCLRKKRAFFLLCSFYTMSSEDKSKSKKIKH